MNTIPEIYSRFSRLIYEHSGLTFNTINISVLQSRLNEQLRKKDGITLEEYYKLVASNASEMKDLLAVVTTNLTKFFRNQAQYDTLKNFILPNIIEHKKATRARPFIRMWSAGCSTGEEVYTNAICLREWLPSDYSFEVLGTDLNPENLHTAKKGIYSKERVEEIPPVMVSKYFVPHDNSYEVNLLLREGVRFEYHNLNDPVYPNNFDIIFCRNVLIYFDEQARTRVTRSFYSSLSDMGYLVIGHSESLFGLDTPFKFIRTQWSSLYGKP
ncbi:protein-glutamate O-methyltransferase CheR [Entomospira entomophila]|uniref:protein-glutamate O-methyltransferase n=1 Tax=Entomospira entomophila TaxID=2719988 RepID=A0A968GCF1_9SPIO|nr:protein-glutamate O-methyltransferase CheR [Entomospira entomophilus]NIZ40856.1 protein-glutamate O-methyltransferase CheR [Entomospira entomophilus]WDI35068.1 protein-glutamate O-methyltransferase CheR [Entomospira entomophilus]